MDYKLIGANNLMVLAYEGNLHTPSPYYLGQALQEVIDYLVKYEQTTPDESSGFHRAAHERTLARLEALEAQLRERSATTGEAMQDSRSDAAEESMTLRIRASLQRLGEVADHVHSHAEQCSGCADVMAAFWAVSSMLAQGAVGRGSISRRQGMSTSADPAAESAPSRSPGCPTHDGKVCGDCEEMWMGKGRCATHHHRDISRPQPTAPAPMPRAGRGVSDD